jgi:tRNA A-37 threonylcarbamoyl transferase component Bud32/tetratricopeptide (TPR) repeat protein/TolB-like protein
LNAALEGRYVIDRELGQGGMATVYLAEDVRHQRRVALKVLRPELAATMGPDRFLQEVRVTANLQHPHILPLFDSGEADGFLYYVMPYIEGESLRERLAREGELPVAEAVKILSEVVDALAAAHALGVVHRDIKPDNVMLSGRHAVVTDFGIAKAVSEATGRHEITTEGVALGTPTYMAPEQAAADEHIDHRADIYALGAMGYELLAGRPPFQGRTAQQVLAAHVTEAPLPVTERRSAVQEGLAAVIMRCLAKRPADRWQSADELHTHLQTFATPATGITPTRMQAAVATSGVGLAGKGASAWIKIGVPVTVVALAAGAWAVMGRGGAVVGDAGSAAAGGEVAAGVEQTMFVVAPFQNQSGVDSLDAFGAILADYVTSQISRNDIGPVVPSSTVRTLNASHEPGTDPIRHYGGGTGSEYVIAGAYFGQGGSLVVQAEVTMVAGSELVSSVGPVDGPISDFMETARLITEPLLSVTSRIADPRGLASSPSTTPPRVYSAYRDYIRASEHRQELEYEAAAELLYRALEADSTYAEALVLTAITEWNLGGLGPVVDSLVQVAERYRADLTPIDLAQLDWIRAWVDGDKESVLSASIRRNSLGAPGATLCRDARMANRPRLAIEACGAGYDESSSQPASVDYFWLDFLHSLHQAGEYETMLAEARAAREIFPDESSLVAREIQALAATGRVDDIDPLLRLVQERSAEPGWNFGRTAQFAAQVLAVHGHGAVAEDALERAVVWLAETQPETELHAYVLYQAGRLDEARAIVDSLLAEDPDDISLLGLLGVTLAKAGDRDAALEVSARLEEIEARPYVQGRPTSHRAGIAAELGDLDDAVRLLNEAYSLGEPYSSEERTLPWFAPLQGYAPYERFIEPKG